MGGHGRQENMGGGAQALHADRLTLEVADAVDSLVRN